MRLIDADALTERIDADHCASCSRLYPCSECGLGIARESIENTPTIDAVPVVRCKDCTKWDKSTMEHYEDVFSGSGDTAKCQMLCEIDTWGECPDEMKRTDSNWFCADGERKKNDI